MTEQRELLAELGAKIAVQELALATIKACEAQLARLAPEIAVLQQQLTALWADSHSTTWGERTGGSQEMD